jgi:hypothetical protein
VNDVDHGIPQFAEDDRRRGKIRADEGKLPAYMPPI